MFISKAILTGCKCKLFTKRIIYKESTTMYLDKLEIYHIEVGKNKLLAKKNYLKTEQCT